MNYKRVTSINDPDIPILTSILQLPEISHYISIDKNNYWTYVTTDKNVYYFKAYNGNQLAAALHLETVEKVLYMDVMVFPCYQRHGLGSRILRDIIDGKLLQGFDSIEVSIDESNTASLKLFEKAGFVRTSQEDELINYVYKMK